MPLENLKSISAELTPKAGKLGAIKVEKEDFKAADGKQVLTVNFAIDTDKGPWVGQCEFQFVGFKGHLLSFNVHQK